MRYPALVKVKKIKTGVSCQSIRLGWSIVGNYDDNYTVPEEWSYL